MLSKPINENPAYVAHTFVVTLILWLSAIAFFCTNTEARASVKIEGTEIVFSTDIFDSGRKVFLASNLQRWDSSRTPMTETSPGFYVARLPLPWAKEIQYKFVSQGEWFRDTENPDSVDDGQGGSNSKFALPGMPRRPELQPIDGGSNWNKSELRLPDRQGRMRTIVVFGPTQSHAQGKTIKTIYAHDGGDYELQTGLQNLIVRQGESAGQLLFRLVMIAPADRMTEYFMSQSYADWVHHDVIPAVAKHSGVVESKKTRLMIGASLGGLAAIYHASVWPEDFGTILGQSSSLQLLSDSQFRNLVSRIKAIATTVDFSITAGHYETKQLFESGQKFFADLNSSGLRIRFSPYPCQHQWDCWNQQLPDLVK